MLELDPFDALTLTLHHAPGTCALLLGSGLSRSAGIPTGWEITLDLVKRVAAVRGQNAGDDPAAWCRENLGVDPDYSALLDAVASTPDERRAILQAYIEARDGEDGRQPTAAHRAIARLVARGAVRVIVTTNFDRLLEQALAAEGIQPTVISSDDTLTGAVPLIHSPCTIMKVHGDYLDTRIRNIDSELAAYSAPINGLLDRIFDDFGLIVCGWSGEWDEALRKAIARAPNRRYPTYWAARGEPASAARGLIEQRKARMVPIAGADAFFSKVEATLAALAEADRPHPTSVRMLVALAKRLCSDESQQVAWSDLLFSEAEAPGVHVTDFSQYGKGNGHEEARLFVDQCVAATERLRRIFLVCGRWGSAAARFEPERTLVRLAQGVNRDGVQYTHWIALQRIPATLCFYWYCAGALAAADYATVKRVFDLTIAEDREPRALLDLLPPTTYDGMNDWRFLNTTTSWKMPASHYVGPIMEREASDIGFTGNEGGRLFDDLEALIAMEFGHRRLMRKSDEGFWHFWAPVGKFRLGADGALRFMAFETMSEASPYLAAGFFGGRREHAIEAVKALRAHASQFE